MTPKFIKGTMHEVAFVKKIFNIFLFKILNIIEHKLFIIWSLSSKVIEDHIRSSLCFKIIFFFKIWSYQNFLRMVSLWNLDLRSYGQLSSLFFVVEPIIFLGSTLDDDQKFFLEESSSKLKANKIYRLKISAGTKSTKSGHVYQVDR